MGLHDTPSQAVIDELNKYTVAIKNGDTGEAPTAISETGLRIHLIEEFKGVIDAQNKVLTAAIAREDREFLRTLILNENDIMALINPQSTRSLAVYGNALEKLVERTVQADDLLARHFIYAANRRGIFVAPPGRIDWGGAGVLEGMLFELTTVKGRAAHQARYYMENAVIFVYEIL
jgi:hypothetical protein